MDPRVNEALILLSDAMAWYRANYNEITPNAVNDLISLKRRYDTLAEQFAPLEEQSDEALAAVFFPQIQELARIAPAWLRQELAEM